MKNEYTHETQSYPVPEEPWSHEFPGHYGDADKCHYALFRVRCRPVSRVRPAVTTGTIT